MEPKIMGRVVVPAKVESLADLYLADRGHHDPKAIRTVEVQDAQVDTGATLLGLPRRMIDRLGLKQFRTRRARTPTGIHEFGIFDAVRLTVQGRDFITEVMEVGEHCPVLIGQIALQGLDFVVDPVGQRLIGNPDHNGEQMVDLY